MANAKNVHGDADKIYKAKQPVFSSVLYEVNNQVPVEGVRVVDVTESARQPDKIYDPNHSMANEEGYIYQSNVNPIEEMANMISASRSYQNNVEVLNTAKQLLLATLRLGQ